MQTDPVCGMQVDEKSAAANSNYKDKTYFFARRTASNSLNNLRKHSSTKQVHPTRIIMTGLIQQHLRKLPVRCPANWCFPLPA